MLTWSLPSGEAGTVAVRLIASAFDGRQTLVEHQRQKAPAWVFYEDVGAWMCSDSPCAQGSVALEPLSD